MFFSEFDYLIIPIAALLILVGGAASIIASALRSRNTGGDPGIGTTRRIFLYGLAFAALVTAASGLALLTSALLSAISGDVIAGDGASALAFGIAAGGVGFAVWALLWRAAQRSVERHPAEAGALGRKVYVYIVLGGAAMTVAFSLTLFISDLLDGRSTDLGDLAVPLVWAGVWAFHWRIESAEGEPSPAAATVRRLYLYAVSTYGLILLAAGAAVLGGALLNAGYHAVFDGSSDPDGVAEAWSFAIVGAALWGTHWLWFARGDVSGIRQAVLYVVGVFGGMAAVTGALSTLLVIFARWPLDPERGRSAVGHFDPVPETFAVLLVTAAVAAYHRRTALVEAVATPEQGVRAQRAYRYLSAAIGLGTLWVALTLLIAIAVGLAVPSAQGSFTGQRWWGLPLSIGVTLLIVGAGLWGWHWPRQLSAARSDADERASLSPARLPFHRGRRLRRGGAHLAHHPAVRRAGSGPEQRALHRRAGRGQVGARRRGHRGGSRRLPLVRHARGRGGSATCRAAASSEQSSQAHNSARERRGHTDGRCAGARARREYIEAPPGRSARRAVAVGRRGRIYR